MRAFMGVFQFLVLLLSITSEYAHADSVEGGIAAELEKQHINTASLRQRRGQDERRLFAWGNLLYALKVCHGNGGGICPKPHCDGPLKPPSCKNSSGGSGGSSSGGGSSGQAKYASYAADDASDRANGDFSGVEFSDGVSESSTTPGATSTFKFLWYAAALAAVSTVVGVFLLKKRQSNTDDPLAEHELSQCVSKRLEKLLSGKGVSPIDGEEAGPSFMEVGKNAPALQSVLPKPQLAEPDEEAIEIKLDSKRLSADYVKMA